MKHMTGDRFLILKLEGNYTSWKRKMALYFRLNIGMAIIVEGYELSIDDNNSLLPLSRLTKKQKEEVANSKAKLVLEQALPKSQMSKIGKYSTEK